MGAFRNSKVLVELDTFDAAMTSGTWRSSILPWRRARARL